MKFDLIIKFLLKSIYIQYRPNNFNQKYLKKNQLTKKKYNNIYKKTSLSFNTSGFPITYE